MGLSDYFGRFWFASEPVFGIVMTLCFLAILRNQALYAFPTLIDRAARYVVTAAITCCIAWGIVMAFSMFGKTITLRQEKTKLLIMQRSRRRKMLAFKWLRKTFKTHT